MQRKCAEEYAYIRPPETDTCAHKSQQLDTCHPEGRIPDKIGQEMGTQKQKHSRENVTLFPLIFLPYPNAKRSGNDPGRSGREEEGKMKKDHTFRCICVLSGIRS